MALGKRKIRQEERFVAAAELRKGPGHPFYSKLNTVLSEAGFDSRVEALCAPHYRGGGRPGIPPGVYFRMVFIGYFEGIGPGGRPPCAASRWPCASTVIRQRLPETVFDEVFRFLLGLLENKGLLKGRTLGIDATTLEANAAMKGIVRKDTGDGWKDYLRKLANAEGIESPNDADLQRLDRSRQDKKVSNEHWESPSDPEARIARMKDGTTHPAYKAEHAGPGGRPPSAKTPRQHRGAGPTGAETLIAAQANLVQTGNEVAVEEPVADKGCHDNRLLAQCAQWRVRTYIHERQQKTRRWTDKPEEYEARLPRQPRAAAQEMLRTGQTPQRSGPFFTAFAPVGWNSRSDQGPDP